MDYKPLHSEAERGSLVAQGILGMPYLFGDEVTQDYGAALRLLTAAAERGAARPTVWRGTMYESGLGVAIDLQKAHDLYQYGVERNEFFGCVSLARLYATGALGSIDRA
jgi:TPR repeat protein